MNTSFPRIGKRAYLFSMCEVAPTNWSCRGREAFSKKKTLVMGILNVTPDSFSDAGQFLTVDDGVTRALTMIEEGADILDIGGESTRPGSTPVSMQEEIRRTIPVIKRLREQTDCLISIDTQKSGVARAAMEAGADIINDVSALADSEMGRVAAESAAGLVLMHMQGRPETMQDRPAYTDAVSEVRNFLVERMNHAIAQGVAETQIVLDPGIGFGKRDEHNLELLRHLSSLTSRDRPILIGVSRKSFIGRWIGREVGDRLAGSLAVAVVSMMNGARILRVHDVKETCDAVRLVDTIRF